MRREPLPIRFIRKTLVLIVPQTNGLNAMSETKTHSNLLWWIKINIEQRSDYIFSFLTSFLHSPDAIVKAIFKPFTKTPTFWCAFTLKVTFPGIIFDDLTVIIFVVSLRNKLMEVDNSLVKVWYSVGA